MRVYNYITVLTGSPWIYAVIGLSVLLDVFLPVLPSGVLVVAAAATAAGTGAATMAAGTTSDAAEAASAAARTASAAAQVTQSAPSVIALIISAAVASVLGDMVAYRIAFVGGERLDRAIAHSRRLTKAQERLGNALSQGGGALVVLARFAPAGRSVVSFGAGATHRRVREFLPWSVVAGVAWAAYSVTLGYFGGHWLGAGWLATGVSLLALFAAGTGAAYLMRRPVGEHAHEPAAR